LITLGVKLERLNLFGPIEHQLKIKQKVLKYTPSAKLKAIFVGLLGGMESMVELDKCLGADPALQLAFGLEGCPEQSVVQDTLDACEPLNCQQMEAGCTEIYRNFGAAPRHNFQKHWLVLDGDFTQEGCGDQAEKATKGYFGKAKRHFGRQVGRILASQYGEIVVDRLYPGNVQLISRFQELVLEAEKRLGLTETHRQHTLLPVDSGAGSAENINWALERGYAYHGKSFGRVSQELKESVTQWLKDPKQPEREVGWVGAEVANPYLKPTKRIVVRCRKRNSQWAYGVIVSSLSEAEALQLAAPLLSDQSLTSAEKVLLAYVYYYDQRGGGIETSIKEDRQGLVQLHRKRVRNYEARFPHLICV
jgi:hypothetical protein